MSKTINTLTKHIEELHKLQGFIDKTNKKAGKFSEIVIARLVLEFETKQEHIHEEAAPLVSELRENLVVEWVGKAVFQDRKFTRQPQKVQGVREIAVGEAARHESDLLLPPLRDVENLIQASLANLLQQSREPFVQNLVFFLRRTRRDNDSILYGNRLAVDRQRRQGRDVGVAVGAYCHRAPTIRLVRGYQVGDIETRRFG